MIDELGYPCRDSLCNWYEEYLANDSGIPDTNPCQHYGGGLKRVAVDRRFEHGKCLARTCRAPGCPSKELFGDMGRRAGARQAEGEPGSLRLR